MGENNSEFISIGENKGYITIKNDRIFYANNKNYNFKDPEEKIRASTYVKLIEKYKYPLSRIIYAF